MSKQELIFAPEEGLSRLKWEYEKERVSYDDLLCFGTAEMDYCSPAPMLSSLHSVLDKGYLGYPMATDEFFSSIEKWLYKTAGWKIDAYSSVAQNVGVYMSAWSVLDSFTKIGDKITILTPVHFCFKRMIVANGRTAIECPLIYNNGSYSINYDALEACFQSGSKMLWLCNPHNPIGLAWSKDELLKVAELCLKYKVLILSDDVYCGLVFPGVVYTPIAALSKKISYQTITLYSISKTYNTMGLKHSYLVAENPELFKEYNESLTRMDLNYGLNMMGMAATISAYNECESWLEELRKEIYKNYSFISNYFTKYIPGAVVTKSNSTYFAWVDMRALGLNGKQLSYLLEQEEHIVVENGDSLGKGGSGFIRINLATKQENLEKCTERIKNFWQRHIR